MDNRGHSIEHEAANILESKQAAAAPPVKQCGASVRHSNISPTSSLYTTAIIPANDPIYRPFLPFVNWGDSLFPGEVDLFADTTGLTSAFDVDVHRPRVFEPGYYHVKGTARIATAVTATINMSFSYHEDGEIADTWTRGNTLCRRVCNAGVYTDFEVEAITNFPDAGATTVQLTVLNPDNIAGVTLNINSYSLSVIKI